MMKICALLALTAVLLEGCYAARPVVSIDSKASFDKYQAIEVLPVVNKTERTYDFDVAQELTQKIKERLAEQGLVLMEGTEGDREILTVSSVLVAYEPGNAVTRWATGPLIPAGKTQATVKTTLVDKKSGAHLGDLATAEVVSGGGLYSVGADHWILDVIAKGLANEISQRIKRRAGTK